MIKNFLLTISLAILSIAYSHAQQDPAAKEILDRVSKKNKEYTSIQVDFELIIDNRRDEVKSQSSGKLIIKGDKYYMEMPGNQVFYDGTSLWSYMEDINEATVSEPDKGSSDFMENPSLLFDFYNQDFKYRLAGEVKLDAGWMYEIDLFPNNLDQPYSRFKLYINRNTEDLYKISAIGKDGVDYTAIIRNPKYNEAIEDSQFSFSKDEHAGVEVIDLRF